MVSRSRSFVWLVAAVALASCNPAPAAPNDTGTDTGPAAVDMGTSSVDMARPDTGPAPDPCATNHDCVSCFSAMGCGWCGTTNACVSGGQNGSNDGRCTGSNWTLGGLQAYCMDAVAFCAMNTDCGSCTNAPVCGWCNGQCLPGTGMGPVMGGHDATCSTAWAWQTADCTNDAGAPVDAGPAPDAGSSVDAGSSDVGASPG
jgi:hypothetical protein